MDPLTTMKFLEPFDLTPVTLLTKMQVLPIIDLPGSIINLRFRGIITSLMESMRSIGVGIFV